MKGAWKGAGKTVNVIMGLLLSGSLQEMQEESRETVASMVCVLGGGSVYRIVHGIECMFVLASRWPFPGFCGTCCISWIQTVLFFPSLGKPHHFQTVPSLCFPLSHSPVIFPFPDPVPTLRSHSLTLVCTPKEPPKSTLENDAGCVCINSPLHPLSQSL